MYYYQQGNNYNPYAAAGLKGRPVSSLEEVRASQIDFDGSLFFFPDIAHNRIYTKQVSMDGNSVVNVYELGKIPTNNLGIDEDKFVTREEFEKVMEQVKEKIAGTGSPAKTQTPKEAQGSEPAFNF